MENLTPPETRKLAVYTVDSKLALDLVQSSVQEALTERGYQPQSSEENVIAYSGILLIYKGEAQATILNDDDESEGKPQDFTALRIALSTNCPESDEIHDIVREAIAQSIGIQENQFEPEENDGVIEYTIVAPPDRLQRKYVSPGLEAMALKRRLRHIIE